MYRPDPLPTKQNLVEKKFWLVKEMALVAQAKQYSRNIQGLPLNLFILNRQKDNDELAIFIDLLNKNLDSFLTPTNFQLAVGDQGHWTAFNFIVQKDFVHVFCVDAADDGRGDAEAHYIANAVIKSTVYYLQPDVFLSPLLNEKVLRKIQGDEYSCAQITMGHALILSQFNTQVELKDIPFQQEEKVRKINPTALRGGLSKLFKFTQDQAILESLPDEIKDHVVNTKGQTLSAFFKTHATHPSSSLETKSEDRKDAPKQKLQFSTAVQRKKEHFASKFAELMKVRSEKDILKLMVTRQGFDFLRMSDEERQLQQHAQVTQYPLPKVAITILNKRIKQLETLKCHSFSEKYKRYSTVKQCRSLIKLLEKTEAKKFVTILNSKLSECDRLTQQRIASALDHYKFIQPSEDKSKTESKPIRPAGSSGS